MKLSCYFVTLDMEIQGTVCWLQCLTGKNGEGFCVTEKATAQEWLLLSWQQSLQGYNRWGEIFLCHMNPSCTCPLQLWLFSGRCDHTCPSYNSHCILWIVVQSCDWNALEGAPFPHLLPVKDNKNLLDWAMSSHSAQDTSDTDFVSCVSLATSTIMLMSCWSCAHMGQLWSVASFYSRQSARENKVSAHCQHSTGAWQSISSLPDRNVFQLHYLWQQLRNRCQMWSLPMVLFSTCHILYSELHTDASNL